MSLMKTLAKVAIGVAVAKGASSMMKRSSQGGGSAANAGADSGLGGMLGGLVKNQGGTGSASAGGQGGLGGMLGGLVQNAGGSQRHGGAHSPAQPTGGGAGGLEDMLGGLLGGGAAGGKLGSGGLGGLLEQLGGAQGSGGSGGLGGLLGGLAGAAGATAAAKGGGDLLAGTDETLNRRPERENASFGEVLNSQFDSTPEPEIEPSRDQEAAAGLMLAAMIQAAKSDGQFDAAEREKLLDRLGDVDAAEAAFVKRQMAAPVDVEALVRQTPNGLAPQVYAMSLLGIDLDTQDEAQYLHKLATAYGMKPAEVNSIHEQMGMPSLYA